MRRSARIGLVCAVTWGACGAVSAQTYSFGHTWNRQSEWVPGPTPGSTVGNPSPDPQGSPVWAYESVPAGDPLGGILEWYKLRRAPQVWDDDWFGTTQGAWTLSNDTNPPIFRNRMTHNLVDSSYDRVPVVRWLNPTGKEGLFDLTGTLTVLWTGDNFTGEPVDVDVVIAKKGTGSGLQGEEVEKVWSTTVSKPNPGPTVGDIVQLEIDIEDIELDEDGWLLWSLRGQDRFTGSPGRWVVLYDYALNVTYVPAPPVLGLVGLGLVGLTRRRR
jgi:uncharacterized protein (TIGR03382 family)